ncbi:MAG: major capsid protein [Solirubrobacteraceae bacterium]
MKTSITDRLGRVASMSDTELGGFQVELIGELASVGGGGDSAAAIGELHALQLASDVVQRAVESRQALAASAAPADPGATLRRMARNQRRPAASPEVGNQAPRTALIASGNGRGSMAGAELDRRQLAETIALTLDGRDRPQGAPGARGRDVLIASADWSDQYPEERRLRGEYEHDTRVTKAALEPDALVATGGICAPVNVDWAIGTIATADRPLRDAFPTFQAGRGGLIYRPDLDFAALEAATGIWTEATDLSPAGATKPIYTVACPSTDTVYVEAVSTRLGFGNMQSRFDPETVQAFTDASFAAAAHVADNNLLNLIATNATQGVTTSQVLGATRDLLMAVGQVVAAFRNLHRVSDNQRLRACFPRWARDLLRVDLARESAHQQDDQWNSLAVSDAQIEALFDAYGVTPVWHFDGQATTAPGLSGAVNQYFTTQSGSGVVQKFPTELVWYMWYEGAFQLLDGGRLDLGIVRDSLLDSTNDFETFTEIFETLAYRGFSGGAVQIISTLCANGASAGTTSTSSSCA